MSVKTDLIIYNRFRAWGAFIGLAILLSPIIINAIFYPDDFGRRFDPFSSVTILLAIAVVWWCFALWADAFQVLRFKDSSLSIQDDILMLPSGERIRLNQIHSAKILERFLRRPRIMLDFKEADIARFEVVTAFQDFGTRAAAGDVARAIETAAKGPVR